MEALLCPPPGVPSEEHVDGMRAHRQAQHILGIQDLLAACPPPSALFPALTAAPDSTGREPSADPSPTALRALEPECPGLLFNSACDYLQ